MTETKSQKATSVRTAEVIGSLCLATDLGMGFPFEQGLRATMTTMRLCDALEIDSETAAQTYYAALLTHIGCTVDAEIGVRIFRRSMTETGGHRMFGSPFQAAVGALSALVSPEEPWPVQMMQFGSGLPKAARYRKPHFVALCEVAEMLTDQLGLPRSVSSMFHYLTERWDGWSHLRRAKRDEVPLPMRIAHVGRDATYQRVMGDDNHVVETIQARSEHAFDPEIVRVFVADASEILGPREPPASLWDDVLAVEPKPWLALEGEAIDRALGAIGAFSDLASPYLSGHSVGVGNLAQIAAELANFDPDDVETLRRAGYVMDVGKVSVHPRIWDKEGPLTADEWEQVRLHPYQTERILTRSPYLNTLARIGGTHHERLDGSGYHRGMDAASLPRGCRLLAAADAFRSKIEPRPYRGAMSPEEAASVVTERAREGLLDGDMVAAVVEAAGQPEPDIERPAGLTEREVEVLGHLAQGLQTKQVARKLDISIKTADRHIQNAYRKIGVSTRAGATLFATERGIVQRRDLPTVGENYPP